MFSVSDYETQQINLKITIWFDEYVLYIMKLLIGRKKIREQQQHVKVISQAVKRPKDIWQCCQTSFISLLLNDTTTYDNSF